MTNPVQDKLNALRELYAKNLPNKVGHIVQLWQKLQTDWNSTQFQDFHREIHSLCGSAGTYGYPELSKSARQTEIFVKKLLDKQDMSLIEQKQISAYLTQLQTILATELRTSHEIEPIHEVIVEPSENKCVYVMEQDPVLLQQLLDSLKQIGYFSYPIQDIITLQMAVKEKPPVAIVIDTHYLDSSINIQHVMDLQKTSTISIQLFCILPGADLLPRLKAIRVNCQAFFQKPVDVAQLIQLLNYKCSNASGESYRILVIDDTESLGEYYALILNQAGMTARAISNPMNLFSELEAFQPHLLLMDVYMPECTGFELSAVLRLESVYTKIPIIFLSTEDNKDKKLFAISLGGDDFLTKPISPQHLISAVRARSKRASILNYYMTTDSLTGLLNHSTILKQFDTQIAQIKITKQPLAFVMIDIDYFKKINDTYGHPIGDMVIKKLSSLLLAQSFSQDSIGRYGGEEFALILPGYTLTEAKNTVDNLLVQFAQYPFKIDSTVFYVTFSAGIASADSNQDAAKIIEYADQALYEAKLKGRNQVLTYTSIE